jgi:3,4-dihydroxy-2-butanone 4-phosphate synthase
MDYVASINEDIGTVDDGKGNCVPVEEDTMKFLGLDYMVELKHTEDAQEFMSQVLNNK